LLISDERLKLADHFTVIPLRAGEYRVCSLSSSLVLKSEAPDLLERLMPLLDGNRTVGEVVAELGLFDADAVRSTLQSLLDAGILDCAGQSGTGALPPNEARRFRSQIAFFAHFVVPPDAGPVPSPVGPAPGKGIDYQERLKRAHVAVIGLGRLGSQLVRSLAVAGIGKITAIDPQPLGEDDLGGDGWFEAEKLGRSRADVVGELCKKFYPALRFRIADGPAGEPALSQFLAGCNFAVLCPDYADPTEYDVFNRAALASKTMWTSARFAGFEFHIGPTVIPGETPCYECFRLRINSNVADYGEHILLEAHGKHRRAREAALSIMPASGLLALEVLKAVTWFAAPACYAHFYSFNLLTMQSELHPILKIPRCTACGRPSFPRPTIHAWQQTGVELPS
jgi:ribosomal protein S12 methylthiotransferase accessory factor